MVQSATNVPVKTEVKKAGESATRPSALEAWTPFANLRQEMDRLFDDFGKGFSASPFRPFDFEPFWSRGTAVTSTPAVDIAESDRAYEIAAELPGMDEKNIEVKVSDGALTIKGEKQEEKEEKKKDYYLHERHFGSFQRSFRLPDGVDAEKIEATFKKGVLTVTLPKTPQAQKAQKTIAVKSA